MFSLRSHVQSWSWNSLYFMDIRVNHCIYKIPSPVPIGCQMNPILTLPSCLVRPKHVVSFLRGFQSEACMNLICTRVPHTHLSYHLWFYHLKSVCSGVQIMKLLFMQFIQPPCLSTWGPNGYLTTLFMNTVNLCSYEKLYSH